jgi:predicted RNase H-like nuclease (RuvC/YqgF family)
MSLLSFSQTDTNKVCIDKSIARQIAVDLVKKDLNDSIIVNITRDNNLLLKKIEFKDSTISAYSTKVDLFKHNESMLNQKIEYKDKEISDLSLSLSKQKKLTLGAVIGGGALFILSLFIK